MSKKIDYEKQAAALARMKEELARLNDQFDAACKSAGIKSEADLKADPAQLPPEMRASYEKMKAEAEKAGRAAAAALEAEVAADDPAPARRVRRGALSI